MPSFEDRMMGNYGPLIEQEQLDLDAYYIRLEELYANARTPALQDLNGLRRRVRKTLRAEQVVDLQTDRELADAT